MKAKSAFLKIVITALLFSFLFGQNLEIQAQPDIAVLCAKFTPNAVDISSLMEFYQTLSIDEKEEQVKDWAFYGLFASLGMPQEEIDALLGSDIPMRYSSLKEKQSFKIQPGRIISLNSKDCVMLVPKTAADDKFLEGSIFDQGRLVFETLPRQVHIFAYSLGNTEINLSYVRSVPGADLLSAEYGYIRKEITDTKTLTEFLSEINSLTSVNFKDKSVILGGRKNRFGRAAALSLEDVAVLEQAYIQQIPEQLEKDRRKSYEVFLTKKYEELLQKDKKLKRAIKAGSIKYSYIISQIKKRFPYRALADEEPNVGFSLDPLVDHGGLAQNLEELGLKKGKYSAVSNDGELSKLVDSQQSSLSLLAEGFKKKQGFTQLLKLRKNLTSSGGKAQRHLDSLLQDIELNNTYQTARYDGRMQGTNPAMVLFYTDLTAKLWALNYNNLAPRQSITGFRTLADIKVPKLYWDDFVKLSKTRLWFGLRQESFELNGLLLRFEPVAARVYAASSDPLFPGRESKPNFQSGEFLGWWDNHYTAIADYEPYYYKLNELLKWSCIFLVAKEKHLRSFDFLSAVPVERTLDFETWYKSSPELKNKAQLPFVDRAKFGKTTECFSLLRSNTYPLMGQNFFVSGGVSLASKNDIAGKLFGKTTAKKQGRLSASHKLPLTGQKTEFAGKTKKKSFGPRQKEENSFGSFLAKKNNNKVTLEWQKNEGALLEEYVNELVLSQGTDKTAKKNETLFQSLKGIEKIVRLELGRAYLIKTKAMKDKWVYLAINPETNLSKYSAKAAGTEPDSDAFYAKVITIQQAEKLSIGKFILPILPVLP